MHILAKGFIFEFRLKINLFLRPYKRAISEKKKWPESLVFWLFKKIHRDINWFMSLLCFLGYYMDREIVIRKCMKNNSMKLTHLHLKIHKKNVLTWFRNQYSESYFLGELKCALLQHQQKDSTTGTNLSRVVAKWHVLQTSPMCLNISHTHL